MATTINSNTTDGIVITPDTSGEIELQADGVTKAKVTANGLQDANGASLRGGMYRNLIINGDMRIAQRGTSAVSGSSDFPVDRWRIVSNQSSKFTAQQSSDVPTGQGFKNSIVLTSSSAYTEASGDYFLLQHRFEGNNVEHLHYGSASAKTVTVSFWVKSSLTGTFAGALRDGGSYTTSYIFEYTISSANTWEYKTVTISEPTSGTWLTGTSVGAELSFALGGGSDFNGTVSAWQSTNDFITSSANRLVNTNGATLHITGVQLEVGEGASDFEFLPYDVQLQRCQRYYFKLNPNNIRYGMICPTAYVRSSTKIDLALYFPVIMRDKPSSLTFNDIVFRRYSGALVGGSFSALSFDTNTVTPYNTLLNATVTTGTAGQVGSVVCNNNVNGYLAIEAEL